MINIIILNMKKMLKNINRVLIIGISLFFLMHCVSQPHIEVERTVSIDTLFNSKGQICEIYASIDSVKQGLCIWYDTLGRKSVETTYVDGEWYGPYISYNTKNGNVILRGFYKNGSWDGKLIVYYENGNIESITNFTDGKANGISYVYTDDGALAQKLLYKDDEVVEVIFNNGELALPDPPPVD